MRHVGINLSFLAKLCPPAAAPLSGLTSPPQRPGYRVRMAPRIDHLTACRVDLTLVLLPVITWLEASVTLATSGVPLEVAARVLADPRRRRQIAETVKLPVD